MEESLRVRPKNRLAVRVTPVDLPEPHSTRNAALTAAGNLACLPRKVEYVAVPSKTAHAKTAHLATARKGIARKGIAPHALSATSPHGVIVHKSPTAIAHRKTLVPSKTAHAKTAHAKTAHLATARKGIAPHALSATSPHGVIAHKSPTAIAHRKTLVPAKTAHAKTAHLATARKGTARKGTARKGIAPHALSATARKGIARKGIAPHARLATSPHGVIAHKSPTALILSAAFAVIENTGKRNNNEGNLATKPRRNLLLPRMICD